MDDAWSVTGYVMPAKFQKMGLSGQSENSNVDTRIARMTSAEHRMSEGTKDETGRREAETYSFRAERT